MPNNDPDNITRMLRGCIVTIENMQTRERRSYHVPGLRTVGIRRIASLCDELGTDWRIASYSTPTTIATDLSGGRFLETPEAIVFGRIGRRDLVHPRLTAHTQWGR